MNEVISKDKASGTSALTGSPMAARFAIAAAGTVILLLASLHILSPEFDPSWRVESPVEFLHC